MTDGMPRQKDVYEHEDILNEDELYALWWKIIRTQRLVNKSRTNELFQKYQITGAEAAALFAIKVIGSEATPASISRFLLRTPHSIWSLLERMEREGCIKRIKDLERKNQVRVVLTEKGKRIYNESSSRESIHKIMAVLSIEERQQLSNYLDKLQAAALSDE
jgi:DNA-binding MarR family transcriptional regulator